MIIHKQSNYYTISNTTNYKWISKPLVILNQETDLGSCPTEYPKSVQISQNEWLFFGGGDLENTDVSVQAGTKTVVMLDTKSSRLMRLPVKIPAPMFAHQVIYIPPKEGSPKGTVYVFGGLETWTHYQPRCFKFDVQTQKFSEIEEWPLERNRYSFNLLPLINNRFILIVSENDPYLIDTKTDQWIQLSQTGHKDLKGV